MSRNAISDAMESLLYQMVEATTMLMYALAGIEQYRQWSLPLQLGVTIPPQLPGICLHSTVASREADELFGPEGAAAQLVYKGWVEQVYQTWDHIERRGIHEAIEETLPPATTSVGDAFYRIRPEFPVMGDFRHIRNDLIHTGIGSEGEVGRCEVLKWFEPGDRIILNFNHVLDFLNQIGALALRRVIVQTNPTGVWLSSIAADKDTLLNWSPVPKLISVRTSDAGKPNTVLLGLVYDNGFHVTIGTPVPAQVFAADHLNMGRGRLDEHGDVMFPNGYRIRVSDLSYKDMVESHFNPNKDGRGIPGPTIQTGVHQRTGETVRRDGVYVSVPTPDDSCVDEVTLKKGEKFPPCIGHDNFVLWKLKKVPRRK